ncbi:hypothetical protein RND81_01G067800 [Saponaria officinalis]|uniref:Uncharacterized protein n=1 Tax=Saponaria officinalis TaxID=3572 RepID=A0AAW1ND79_SAPOF
MSNKGKAPKIQTGGYQSSNDYEMEIQISKPSSSNSKPSSNPIKTSNTFNPLLSQPCRPALPYNYAVQNHPTTQKEKEAKIQNTSSMPGYFIKSTVEPLCLTKYRTSPPIQEFRVNNSNIFAQGIHCFSDNISKNQRFYEFILVDLGSADIKHERCKVTGKIQYSKLIINKVNTTDDWIDPFAEKEFSKRFIPQTYSHNDYKNAWSRALLLEDFDHSWFITFNKTCPKGGRKLEWAIQDLNRQQSSSSKSRPPKPSKNSPDVKQSPEDRSVAIKQMVNDPIFRQQLLDALKSTSCTSNEAESYASSSLNPHVGPCSHDPFDSYEL